MKIIKNILGVVSLFSIHLAFAAALGPLPAGVHPEEVGFQSFLLDQVSTRGDEAGYDLDPEEVEAQSLLFALLLSEADSKIERAPELSADQEKTLMECAVCFDEIPEDDFPVLSCGHHSTCRECLKLQLEVGLRERSTQSLCCGTEGCAQAYNAQDILVVTNGDRDVLSKFSEIQLDEYMVKAGDIKRCPTPDCQFSFVYDGAERSEIQCLSCHQKYCSECLHDHSQSIACQEAQEGREMAQSSDSADRASQEWLRAHAKACPTCSTLIQRSEGCNHMQCTQCSHEFCWLCGAGSYDHDIQKMSCGCPLYGDEH